MNGRYSYALGDGIDTITGEHKGTNFFTTNENAFPSSTSALLPASTVPSGETEYEVILINNYSQLANELGLNTAVTVSVPSLISTSLESDLFKNSSLSKQSVSLLVKGRYIQQTQPFQKNLNVPNTMLDLLKTSPATFVNSHGDSYISELMIGKKIYALINFQSLDQEDALQLKDTLSAKLNTTPSTQVGGSATVAYSESNVIRNQVSNIRLVYSGADITPPDVNSDIDTLFAFINKFNQAPLNQSPIAYVSETYATLFNNVPAANVFESIAMTKTLLAELDKNYNRIRLILPVITNLANNVHQFQEGQNAATIARIDSLYRDAINYQEALKNLILIINLNKCDLTLLPEQLTPTISIDKSNMPPALTPGGKNSVDEVIANHRDRQYFILSQLSLISAAFTTSIQDLEFDLDDISKQLILEILNVPSSNHFHLPLSTNSLQQWNILPEDKAPAGNISFDLFSRKAGLFHCYKAVYRNIQDGTQTKGLSFGINDKVKVKTHNNSKRKYNISVNLVGPEILNMNVSHETKQNCILKVNKLTSARNDPTKQSIHLTSLFSKSENKEVTKEKSNTKSTANVLASDVRRPLH